MLLFQFWTGRELSMNRLLTQQDKVLKAALCPCGSEASHESPPSQQPRTSLKVKPLILLDSFESQLFCVGARFHCYVCSFIVFPINSVRPCYSCEASLINHGISPGLISSKDMIKNNEFAWEVYNFPPSTTLRIIKGKKGEFIFQSIGIPHLTIIDPSLHDAFMTHLFKRWFHSKTISKMQSEWFLSIN